MDSRRNRLEYQGTAHFRHDVAVDIDKTDGQIAASLRSRRYGDTKVGDGEQWNSPRSRRNGMPIGQCHARRQTTDPHECVSWKVVRWPHLDGKRCFLAGFCKDRRCDPDRCKFCGLNLHKYDSCAIALALI